MSQYSHIHGEVNSITKLDRLYGLLGFMAIKDSDVWLHSPKLTTAGKKQNHSSGDRVRTLQGPGTPVRVGRECAAGGVTDEEQVVSRSQSIAAACQVIAKSPLKSKRDQSEHNFCALCLGEIVNGRNEAIFYESRCNTWYHWGCASVSQELLRELIVSKEPF